MPPDSSRDDATLMTRLETPAGARGLEHIPGEAEAAEPQSTPSGLVRLPTGDGPARTRRASLALRLLIPISVFAAWWILTATGVIQPTTLSGPRRHVGHLLRLPDEP